MVLTLQPMGYVGEICVSGDCFIQGVFIQQRENK